MIKIKIDANGYILISHQQGELYASFKPGH